MKKILMIAVCVFNFAFVQAQQYYTGIGLRAGKFNTGASFKFFFNTDNATGLQLDATYTNIASGGYTLRGFVLKQLPFKLPIVQLPLDFIFGGGAHAGYFPFDEQGYYKRDGKDADYYESSVVSAGIDATVQIEYQVRKIAPFTIGIDVNPYYEFLNTGPEFIDFGVTVRYVFK